MTGPARDAIASFYDRHPYPPPRRDLSADADAWADGRRRLAHHHLIWPTRPFRDDPSILVAGCGTSQAARQAVRWPNADVVGIDVSRRAIEETRVLAERHGVDNLELVQLAVEDAPRLGRSFDLVVCTGVLHHLAEPRRGLEALREVVEPDGAIHLMVYATYGRSGVSMLQEYCRRLDIGTDAHEVDELIATLRELPLAHPLGRLLRDTPDFQDRDALADALLNPRERSYAVPELLELVDESGLRFSRWLRQAPYSPECGSLTEVPHGRRIARLPPAEQHAAVELFRGTLARHSAILRRADAPAGLELDWTGERWRSFVPVPLPEVVTIDERLPPGAAVAVVNRSHTFPDLVLFLDDEDRRRFELVDGRRAIREIDPSGPVLFRRLWSHDHVVIDASRETGGGADGPCAS